MPFISASAISPYNSIRGGASGEVVDPILAFNPYNVWDSEHVIIDGTETTFTDFNNVGTTYDLVNPAATNQPTYTATDSDFNNLPSFAFDGIDDYMLGSASNWRSSDIKGAFISVYRLIGNTRLAPLVALSSTSLNYINWTVILSSTFRSTNVTTGGNASYRGSTNIQTSSQSFVIANVSDGSNYKMWVNNDLETITMVTGVDDGSIWFNSDSSGFDRISIGALARASTAPIVTNIKWAFSGYFPYTSDSQIEDIMAFLITKYGL
jgi:hypothetical protein